MLGLAAAPEKRDSGPEGDAAPVPGGRPVAQIVTAAVRRRDGERRRLALLPGKAASRHQVEGEVQHVERPSARVEPVHRDVVVRGKAGELADPALAVRGTEIGADKAIAVHAVQ